MTKDKLTAITVFLIDLIQDNAFRDLNDVFYGRNGKGYYIFDIIASLHNVLYEEVTGEPYHYMYHWANKAGAWVEDDFFDYLDGSGEG